MSNISVDDFLASINLDKIVDELLYQSGVMATFAAMDTCEDELDELGLASYTPTELKDRGEDEETIHLAEQRDSYEQIARALFKAYLTTTLIKAFSAGQGNPSL